MDVIYTSEEMGVIDAFCNCAVEFCLSALVRTPLQHPSMPKTREMFSLPQGQFGYHIKLSMGAWNHLLWTNSAQNPEKVVPKW